MSDRSEIVEVEFDKLTGQSKPGEDNRGAFFIEVDGDEYSVGKSQVDNADELIEDLEKPAWKRTETSIQVPRWLAEDNGWIDEE